MVCGNRVFAFDDKAIESMLAEAVVIEKHELENFAEFEEDTLLSEYVGNDAQNQAFAECLVELEDLMKLYVDRIGAVRLIVDKMVALFNSIDEKGKNFFKIDAEISKQGMDGNKKLKDMDKEIQVASNTVWPKFSKLSSSFGVKYSSVTMQEKEKFMKTLEPYCTLLDDLYNQYIDEEYQQKILDSYDRAMIAAKYIGKDANYVKRIFNIVASWYCWMIDEIVYTIKRIRYVYKQFGSKDSFMFRILNRDYSQLKKIKFTR